MNNEIGSLYQYVVNSPERLLMATKDEGVELGKCKSKKIKQIWRKDTTWAVIRGTEELRDPQTWDWLKRGALKKDTEDILYCCPRSGLPTNYIRNMIELTSKMVH